MKTTIKLLALAFVLFAAACSNDDEINMFNSLWRNVTQNEARIGNLEEWCAQANTNITSLQTIVNVIESNDAITSITPVMEGGVEVGYTITFADHDPITIYHGKDGKDGQDGQDGASPIVGVAKHTNGVYYWTLNGEWLLDENGNKLRVSGEDGANGENGQNGTNGTNGQNGITPQLKIENDYWYVSYNNGNTWTRLGKAKGEDGADGQNGATGAKGDKGDTGAQGAKGDKGDTGDSMFRSVTQDADNVYFILADGTVIAIAKKPYLTAKPNSSDYGTVTGSGYYEPNTETTITATPKENCYFIGWSDSDTKELTRTVQVNSDTIIIANFAKNPYLTTKPNSSDYGTVTGSGYYEVGSVSTITATPKSGYSFVQWNDGNTENPRTVTVTSDVTYTATFKVKAPDEAFSVSSWKYVVFSPGNLQYIRSSDTWQFASFQWECVGTDNFTGGEVTFDEDGYTREGTALADKVDLFAWSTPANNFGVIKSSSYYYYSGSFVDWGTNQIGDDVPNTWRTLTYYEWYYLLEERTNASSLRGVAQVNGVNGLILLPDGWTSPAGVTFKPGFYSDIQVECYAAYQTFTADQWQQMEAAGAVFLPAAGHRGDFGVYYVQCGGYYWSATKYDSRNAYDLVFYPSGTNMFYDHRWSGYSVRLVKDL